MGFPSVNGYHVVHSIRLVDDDQTTLDIILDSNDKAWRLFARLRHAGGDPRESDWRVFPTEVLGKESYAEQVQQAQKMGWREAGQ